MFNKKCQLPLVHLTDSLCPPRSKWSWKCCAEQPLPCLHYPLDRYGAGFVKASRDPGCQSLGSLLSAIEIAYLPFFQRNTWPWDKQSPDFVFEIPPLHPSNRNNTYYFSTRNWIALAIIVQEASAQLYNSFCAQLCNDMTFVLHGIDFKLGNASGGQFEFPDFECVYRTRGHRKRCPELPEQDDTRHFRTCQI